MKPFVFCPSCAARLLDPDHDGGLRCPSCGSTWYRNPAPTVGCVIVRRGRALVTVRASEPHQGRIDVPGGFLQPGEHPVDGLRREVREELGVEIEVRDRDFIQSVAHRYAEDGDWLVSLGFRARLVSGEPSASDDVADIRWVGAEEVDDLDFAWPHDRALVGEVLRRRATGYARWQVAVLCLGRALTGAALMVAPRRALEAGTGRQPTPAAVMATRGLGGRDLVLGVGALSALLGEGSARRWLEAGAAADAADVVGMLSAPEALPGVRRLLGVLVAGGATVLGLRFAASERA